MFTVLEDLVTMRDLAEVAENVQPEKILYYICAMRETFIAHGNYKQRGRARTRYMQETLGEEGYIKASMRN